MTKTPHLWTECLAPVEFLSTHFDVEAVGLLESCWLKRYKIAPRSIANTSFLDAIGRTS
ncbi:MAG: N-acetylneuraminate synthase family protein [Candidatus Obscuribacter sp.]|nr:N-acetylneuraminate synthase family protein [Candidatus Obscuribacter sp.]